MDTLEKNALYYINKEKEYGNKQHLYHYNCAEVLLNACNNYYNLEAGSNLLKAIIPFGGGMCCEQTCGILTGGIAALGLMFAEEKPTSNEKVKYMTQQWVSAFQEQFGSLNCQALKEDHRDDETGCGNLMLAASKLLESIIGKGGEYN